MTYPQIFGKKFTPIHRFSAWKLTNSGHTSLIWTNMGVPPGGPTTSFPRGKLIINWSLWIYLNSFRFYTDCYGEWILNIFTFFWCFLELFIEKFTPDINNERVQDYSCPTATFAFCSHGEKLSWQSRLPGVVQGVTHLSKLPWGKDKFMWTVTDIRPCTEAKLTPGSVSWSPTGKSLHQN